MAPALSHRHTIRPVILLVGQEIRERLTTKRRDNEESMWRRATASLALRSLRPCDPPVKYSYFLSSEQATSGHRPYEVQTLKHNLEWAVSGRWRERKLCRKWTHVCGLWSWSVLSKVVTQKHECYRARLLRYCCADEPQEGSLTVVMKRYKGCLRSVYFTVMGLRSYRNQMAGMMRPVWL